MSAVGFRQLAGIGITPLATWLKRQKLKFEQANNDRTSDVLQRQIKNDTQALALVHRQQAIIKSQLRDLGE